MSTEAVAAVLHHSRAIGTSKVILLGLAWHMNADPELGCWPSQHVLAEYANTTIRQVRRALKLLAEIGEIEIATHAGEGTRFDRITNRYYIRVDCPETCLGGFQHVRPADIYGQTSGHLRSHGGTSKVLREGVSVRLINKN